MTLTKMDESQEETGKFNAPVAGVLCQRNAAVMPDRCSVRPIARDRGCPRVLHRPIPALPGRFATDVAANHAVPGRAKSSAGRAALRSGDVGRRVVGERQAGVHRPGLGTQWRTALHRPPRPQAQVLEDASDDCRILDSNAMTRIGPLFTLRHLGHSKGSAS